MSAIWGIIKKNQIINIEELFSKMNSSMSIFPFDRLDSMKCKNGLFACGHQYFTNEDISDISPVYDKETNTLFCSNCFLYNRDILIEELNDKSLKSSGDSQIAFECFKKWGVSFVNKLRGLFSFAIYEENKNSLHIFSDHFTTSFTVYHINQDFICFSTTFKPILACIGEKTQICREYIVTSYKDTSPINCSKQTITPFKDVFRLDYATHITVNTLNGEFSSEHYWNPLKTLKKIKYKSDEEYKAAFNSLFYNLTSSILRSKDETGIMLSGGLDSSAVASFAAPILKEKGKYLYSYTSVPSTDYKDDYNNSRLILDESPLIEIQKEYHSNILPHYINGDTDSCISDVDYFQHFYDIPVKASINNINIKNMSAAANKDNCSILLSGSNGNATISFGFIHEYFSLNVTKMHFIKAYKEVKKYCKLVNFSRKRFFRYWFKSLYEYIFKKPQETHDFLRVEDEKKYGLTHPALDHKRRYGSQGFLTMRQKNNFTFYPGLYNQKSFYYTYNGLKNHYIQIDPTLTVEIVEFCLNLPLDCFVHNGIERRLVRDYLKDQLPEAVTSMKKGFGVQCSDFHFRVNRDIDKYKDQLFKNLDEPLLRDYLDPQKINPIISEIKKAAETHSLDKDQIKKLVLLASLGGFLRDHTR